MGESGIPFSIELGRGLHEDAFLRRLLEAIRGVGEVVHIPAPNIHARTRRYIIVPTSEARAIVFDEPTTKGVW